MGVAGEAAWSVGSKTASTALPIPTLVSAEINIENPYAIQLYFDIPLDGDVPIDNSNFIIKIGGIPQEFDNDGYAPLILVKSNTPFSYGDIITVSYTQPETNPLRGLAGGLVASFTDYPVTNNILAPE
jgi:hypothetical protein